MPIEIFHDRFLKYVWRVTVAALSFFLVPPPRAGLEVLPRVSKLIGKVGVYLMYQKLECVANENAYVQVIF